MNDAQDSRVGSMFGPYHLKRLLGRGGMGEVYEAEHTVKGWTVAVKLMSAEFSKDPVFRERMKREARIAGRLQEPHVVPIHDYGEVDGQMFLEMRLVEGTDLDSVLKRFGPLTPPRAVAIITQIASALDAAHADGVMHRDVKPQNILVTRDDFAYLVDFGIASATTDEKLTQLGTAVGTWKYMAPERFSNDEVNYRADIYALACVLHECLTGAPPYRADSATTLVTAHLMDPIPQPSAARAGIPKAFDTVVARGMAKKPEDRYASAGDLALAAHDALSDPDQDHAADILRRSQESALPGPAVERQTVQHPRAPHPAPASKDPPAQNQQRRPPAAAGYPSWPPTPAARQPAPTSSRYQRDAWAGGTPPGPPPPQRFAGAAPWNQESQPAFPRGRNPWAIVAGVAALVLVLILGAIGIWAASKTDGNGQAGGRRTTPTTTTTTTTTAATKTTSTPATTQPAADAQARLFTLLPSGYPAGTCTPQSKPMPGSLVSLRCGQNTDANGPRIASFGLFSDIAALKKAFDGFVGTVSIVNCPGGKASPGTWWHTQDPRTILGQLACGIYKGGEPQVMWSNEQTLVFALVAGKPQGPTLDQLYKWWASHS
ncbi:serine/threonine protein kinase [Mycobacterium decipiens]|uniref:non-specific serine/threonine protein kinase n=1 Tax=Mycobacterium decipiens TaxID=1430326 RepID=A0A1X2LVK1_9MYCO|nr:serine/threonine-protein kinase [Mycobacterium decipiens]OSC41045.1 serine/threonine protein kinase [Mycobacterium decipiens]